MKLDLKLRRFGHGAVQFRREHLYFRLTDGMVRSGTVGGRGRRGSHELGGGKVIECPECIQSARRIANAKAVIGSVDIVQGALAGEEHGHPGTSRIA